MKLLKMLLVLVFSTSLLSGCSCEMCPACCVFGTTGRLNQPANLISPEGVQQLEGQNLPRKAPQFKVNINDNLNSR
jgi:hypothetical protein